VVQRMSTLSPQFIQAIENWQSACEELRAFVSQHHKAGAPLGQKTSSILYWVDTANDNVSNIVEGLD